RGEFDLGEGALRRLRNRSPSRRMRPIAMRRLIRRTLGTLAILTLATAGSACSAPQEDAENDASELRALEKGDVDISLLERVAAEGTPPEAFAGIKTWSVH